MFILICVIIVLAAILYSVLMAGGWGALLVYVVAHSTLTVWLFMQSSAGMSFNDKFALGLIWLTIFLYILVAAIVAIVRAIVLLQGRGARQP